HYGQSTAILCAAFDLTIKLRQCLLVLACGRFIEQQDLAPVSEHRPDRDAAFLAMAHGKWMGMSDCFQVQRFH
ncbi:hypothetical protein R0J92_23570, partial [Tritonibacter sp. SIMBA_163]